MPANFKKLAMVAFFTGSTLGLQGCMLSSFGDFFKPTKTEQVEPEIVIGSASAKERQLLANQAKTTNSRYVVHDPWSYSNINVTGTYNWLPVEAKQPTQLRLAGKAPKTPVASEAVSHKEEVTVYFATNSSELTRGASEALKVVPKGVYAVIGHADSRGSKEYNQWLSNRRAQAVAQELKSLGHVVALVRANGEKEASNNPEQYASDRRVHVIKLTGAAQKSLEVKLANDGEKAKP